MGGMTVLGCTALLAGVLAQGQGKAASAALDPERYIAVEVEVRQATVDALHRRLTRLQGRGGGDEVQLALDDESRVQVAGIFRRHRTTAEAHAAYGTRNAARVAAWLRAHPGPAKRLDDLAAELSAVSQRLDRIGRNP